MESFQPKVSIIIPVYNGSDYVGEAIECALSQTYKNLEIIVVNDGSKDDGATEKVAKSYGDKIRYYHKENGGVSTALNYGISVMDGEYFSWLSHDDKYTPTKVEDSVNLLASIESREKLIAYCGGNYINERSEILMPFNNVVAPNKVYDSKELLAISTKGKTLNGCCMLIPKKAFEECGNFDEDLRYCQDVLMWYRMFFSGYKIISEEKQNVMYRLHKSQTSQTRKDLFLHDSICLAEEIIPRLVAECEGNKELVYNYTARNAMLNNKEVVKYCLKVASQEKLFNPWKKIKICFFTLFGKFRGFVKKIYYRLFLKVKV